ncbi:MAG: hypothetical protein ACW964_17250 [Candidatus Hodarchaeales archaeon]
MNLLIKKKFIPLLLFWILLVISFTRGSAAVVWSEDFNTGVSEELTLLAWTGDSEGVFQTNSTAKPTVENNALQMPNTREFGTWSSAQRNSTIAYGTWSFDFTIKKGDDHTACFAFFFVGDFPWSHQGYTFSSMNDIPEVYYIAIKSGSTDNVWGAELDHNMNFGKWDSGNIQLLDNYQFPDDITGTHQIDITRDQLGEFNIYYDSDLIINHTDAFITTSKIFIIGSWSGDISFDNIVVSDTVDPPTTTATLSGTNISFEFLALSLLFLGLFKRKRNK